MGQFGTVDSHDIEVNAFLFDPAALFVAMLVMGVLAAALAGRRGRRSVIWFLYGVVAGPIALAHLVALPKLTEFRKHHHFHLPPWMLPD